jgi:hypothetical protein
MELINQHYSEENNNYNHDDDCIIWSCKCKCLSKKAHKTKWAFISMYKKNTNNYNKKFQGIKRKYQEQQIQTDFIEEIIEGTIEDIESEKLNHKKNILFPKVRYDKELNKIVVEIESETETDKILFGGIEKKINLENLIELDEQKKLNKLAKLDKKNCLDNNHIIQSNNLLELRNLLFR